MVSPDRLSNSPGYGKYQKNDDQDYQEVLDAHKEFLSRPVNRIILILFPSRRMKEVRRGRCL